MPDASPDQSFADSAQCRLTPAPLAAVTLRDRFWAPRQQSIRERSLPTQYEAMQQSGAFAQLGIAAPADAVAGTGTPIPATPMLWDSVIGQWIEAVGATLCAGRDAALEAKADDLIERLEQAQHADGYVNAYVLKHCPERRWSNLRDQQELFSAGQLLEGAIAYAQATGKRRLLDVMQRAVHHIAARFGHGPGQTPGYCGHAGIELALVQLWRLTGERRHLDLARGFIDERGRQPHYFDTEARARGDDPAASYEYSQAHRPVREQDQVVGHAVRAMYLYSAMADLAGTFADPGLKLACERLWQNLTCRRLYVTGGLGSNAGNAGFTADYDLPNDSACAETCAAVGLVFWAHRMLQLDGDGRYADVMELALYNGALAGISLDGEHYFHANPLESGGEHHRSRWQGWLCCPPNIARLIASLSAYVCSTGRNEVAVHLYAQGHATLATGVGRVRLELATDYPWSGEVRLVVAEAVPRRFTLSLRIPAWCRAPALRVNGAALDLAARLDRGYARIERDWTAGDVVELVLPMPVERLRAHPDVRADTDRVALKRGPLVYCLEEADNPEGPHRIVLPEAAIIADRFLPELLGGAVVLTARATFADPQDWQDTLYSADPPPLRPCRLIAVPYHLWDHRAPGGMQVWLRSG
jgi:hypothetical protein